ncbi:MAG: hypothetical protein ACOCUI_05950 [bacterium]
MHKYERYLIYPLLIMSLFYSLAGEQVVMKAEEVMDKLTVREISVVDKNNKEIINIGEGFFGGKIDFKSHNFNERTLISPFGVSIDDKKTRTNLHSFGLTFLNKETENKIISLGVTDNLYGHLQTFNEHGDSLITLGKSTEDHGLVSVYDRYGEHPRNYGPAR